MAELHLKLTMSNKKESFQHSFMKPSANFDETKKAISDLKGKFESTENLIINLGF